MAGGIVHARRNSQTARTPTAPRRSSGKREGRTPCPRWKPHSAPRQECPVRNPCPPAQRPAGAPADGTQHAREHPQAPAPASYPTPPTLEAVPAARREIMQGSTSTDTPAAHNQTAHGEPRHQQTGTRRARSCDGASPGGHDQHPLNSTQKGSEPQ